MLQEATKALNSAFNNSFIKKVSQYLHDCVREEVKSSTFRNLKGDKDNKWIFLKEKETLLTEGLDYLKLDGANPNLTELMIQSENNARDKYLIYGYMFLVGRNGKSKRHNEFLTPLLYPMTSYIFSPLTVCVPADFLQSQIPTITNPLPLLTKKKLNGQTMKSLLLVNPKEFFIMPFPSWT